jgi:hypothetical protein
MKAFLLLFLIALATTVTAQFSHCVGNATTFGVLSSTYTNTNPGPPGTLIDGDLGYTTGPAVNPVVVGTTHVADATYAAAGVDQATALAAMNAAACTFNFSVGAIDLHSNPFGTTYPPGIYCVAGAMSIGGGGIIFLNGTGIHLFRSTGAFTTSANSQVILNGTDPCDVFWTPGAATTLGANTVLVGTVIDNAGITIGSTVDWIGRALSFGGTVSTTLDSIVVPLCSGCALPPSALPSPPVAAPIAPSAPTPTPTAPSATPVAPSAPVAAPVVLSPGAIAGIVIGSVVFALIIIAIIVYCCVSYQRDEEDYEKYR